MTTSKLDSLGTLAGGIAHDLNNILTVISGNIGLAQIEAPDNSPPLHSFLSRAGQAAQQAAQLSNQLLTFSKGGAPVKRVVSVARIVGEAAEFALHGSNIRADVHLPSDLLRSAVDPGQIEQVVNALVINAREAMPHGGTIRISADNIDVDEEAEIPVEPGQYVKVTVADNGIGIDPKSVPKIFDPYFTTKASLPAGLDYRLVIQLLGNMAAFCIWKALRRLDRHSRFICRPRMQGLNSARSPHSPARLSLLTINGCWLWTTKPGSES